MSGNSGSSIGGKCEGSGRWGDKWEGVGGWGDKWEGVGGGEISEREVVLVVAAKID